MARSYWSTTMRCRSGSGWLSPPPPKARAIIPAMTSGMARFMSSLDGSTSRRLKSFRTSVARVRREGSFLVAQLAAGQLEEDALQIRLLDAQIVQLQPAAEQLAHQTGAGVRVAGGERGAVAVGAQEGDARAAGGQRLQDVAVDRSPDAHHRALPHQAPQLGDGAGGQHPAVIDDRQ